MKTFVNLAPYIYAPFFVASLSLTLFSQETLSWILYPVVIFVGYPALSIIFKICSSKFENDIKLFIYDLIATLLIALLLFANMYKFYGILDPNGSVTKEPIDMLYFSIVTWTTLGYGDFRPTDSARMIAAAEAFLGYAYNALFLGLCAGWLLIRFQSKNKFQTDSKSL